MKSFCSILLPAFVAMTALPSSLHAMPVVFESFDYELGSTIVGQGGAADGWAGDWETSGGTDAELEQVIEGQPFEGLETVGGACQRTARFGLQAMSRAISPVAQSALTADDSTIWFSLLMTPTAPTDPVAGGGFALNSWGTFIFGDMGLDGASGNSAAPIGPAGNAVGVSFAGTGGGGDFATMQMQGVTYSDGFLTQEGVTTVGAETSLVVGKVEWAADGSDDVLSLYLVADLTAALPDPFVTMSIDLDQSTFDVVSIGDSQTSVFDEIRFGLSLEEVLGAVGGSGPPEITGISYDATTEPGNILLTITFNSELGKTYTALVNSDLTIPLSEWPDASDGIVGENGSTTFVINFEEMVFEKDAERFFVVMAEN